MSVNIDSCVRSCGGNTCFRHSRFSAISIDRIIAIYIERIIEWIEDKNEYVTIQKKQLTKNYTEHVIIHGNTMRERHTFSINTTRKQNRIDDGIK